MLAAVVGDVAEEVDDRAEREIISEPLLDQPRLLEQRQRMRKQRLRLRRILFSGFERLLDEGGAAQLDRARRQRRLVERGVQRRRALGELGAALPGVDLPELDHRDGE